MQKTRLILLAHGSRDPAWARPFEQLARDTGAMLAFVELAAPTLAEAMDAAVAAGAARVRVLPLFMARGAHVQRDIPDQVAVLQDAYPDCTIELLPSLGDSERFWAVLAAFVRDQMDD